jgi:hypothetical protein
MVAKDMRMANAAHEDDLRRLMWIRIGEEQLEVKNSALMFCTPNNVAMPLHNVVFQW